MFRAGAPLPTLSLREVWNRRNLPIISAGYVKSGRAVSRSEHVIARAPDRLSGHFVRLVRQGPGRPDGQDHTQGASVSVRAKRHHDAAPRGLASQTICPPPSLFLT